MNLKEMKEHVGKRVAANLQLVSAHEVVGEGQKYLALTFGDGDVTAAGRITKKYQADDYFSMVGNVVFVKAVVKQDDDGALYLSVSKIEPTEEGVDVGKEETEAAPESEVDEKAETAEERRESDAPKEKATEDSSWKVDDEIIAEGEFYQLLVRNLSKALTEKTLKKEIPGKHYTVYDVLFDANNLSLALADASTLHIEGHLYLTATLFYTVACLYKERSNSFVAKDENGDLLDVGFIAAELVKRVADEVSSDKLYNVSYMNRLQHALLAIDDYSKCRNITERLLNSFYGRR